METAALSRQITIAGGGLAGLALGLGLRRRGLPVTLHEAGTYPRHRVCGEFISGLGEETIRTLGLEGVMEGAQQHQRTTWWVRDRPVFRGSLPESALGISRFLLDGRLSQAFRQLGGTLIERSRIPEGDLPGQVWASGRQRTKGSPWLGLKAHFFNVSMMDGLEMHLGKGTYVGLTPVEDGRVNVCGLIRGTSPTTTKGPDMFLELMEKRGLSGLASRLRRHEFDPESFQGVSALGFGPASMTASGCRIGDAHSLIPPFTGHGMAMAFQSAETVLPHLEAYAHGASDWGSTVTACQETLERRFQRRLTMASRLHPLLMRPLSQRVIGWGGRLGCLPFQTLYRAVR